MKFAKANKRSNSVVPLQMRKRGIFHYIKKENGGKHTALNAGIKEINSLLTFIVDSDDWLLPNAIEEVINSYEKYKREDKRNGIKKR